MARLAPEAWRGRSSRRVAGDAAGAESIDSKLRVLIVKCSCRAIGIQVFIIEGKISLTMMEMRTMERLMKALYDFEVREE